MRFFILVASCCFISLGSSVSSIAGTTSQEDVAVARSIADNDGSIKTGVLRVRTHEQSKGSASQQKAEKTASTKQTSPKPSSSRSESDKTSAASSIPGQEKKEPSIAAAKAPVAGIQELVGSRHAAIRQSRRPNLVSSLRSLRLGVSPYACPAPCNRSQLRPMVRVSQNRRPTIRNARPRTSNSDAIGLAFVQGPATIRKAEGQHAEAQESRVEAGHTAIVKARHRFAIAISGEADRGGCITGRVEGDCVGAVVDARPGGSGYLRDESVGKNFKDLQQQTQEVAAGEVNQKSYLGDLLTGSAAATKGRIAGPGAISMAAMRVPEGEDRKKWMGQYA